MLVDVQEFEEKMETFLRNRKAAGGVLQTSEEGLTAQPFGMSLAFVGLLFAVLASGCQSSNLPGKERELTSQVYSTYALELGFSAFHANLEPSLLFLPMFADDQFRVATNPRSHEDPFDHWKCLILQHESWCFLCPSRYVDSHLYQQQAGLTQ